MRALTWLFIQAVQLYEERQWAMFGQKKVCNIEVAEQLEDSNSSKTSQVQLKSTENQEFLHLNQQIREQGICRTEEKSG